MNFRKSEFKDIEKIMLIISQAQAYLKSKNINQWQNNYPNEGTIKDDIEAGYSYVLEEGGDILATTALSFDGEETYDEIYEGSWISDFDYGVIHRIAVDSDLKGQGIGGKLLKEVEKLCLAKDIFSLRIDTHRENESMIRFIRKNGFEYCGVIYLKDGNERIAFEKILE